MKTKEARDLPLHRLSDGWLMLFGIPTVAFLVTFFFYSDEWILGGRSFMFCFMSKMVTSSLLWYLNRGIVLYYRRRYTSIESNSHRIAAQLLTSFLVSGMFSLFVSWLYQVSGYWGRVLVWQDFVYNLIIVEFFVFLISGIYEAIFYFARWRYSVMEAEELKKANLQSQFESLKNQVSPHFLFNSLNTLSSLIEENPETAVRFVNQLSKVYRYLLQSNEKELTTIKDELEFLEAYLFLLKTRFGEGLHMDISLPESHLCSWIPPLTLQILVENAVKHNVVSSTRPLHIEIRSCTEDTICVINNVQKKTINVASNGMGLANIKAKYKLLNRPPIRIEDGPAAFTITLPIIKN
ncbi:MAG: histidine kinase [Bacteroidia bacterium]|nr:histidine kinase [Bacteroidia bacterium]